MERRKAGQKRAGHLDSRAAGRTKGGGGKAAGQPLSPESDKPS
jgi:hypothetical protein